MDGLISAYTTLISNATVRLLLKSVHQDAQLETINHTLSKETILAVYNSIETVDQKTTARLLIIGFLNQAMYAIYPKYPGRTDVFDPANIWLWENHTRLSKLLAVSMVLESENLKSFGVAEPDWSDIPQALIKIAICIRYAKNNVFKDMGVQHKGEVGVLELCDPTYVSLYTNNRTK